MQKQVWHYQLLLGLKCFLLPPGENHKNADLKALEVLHTDHLACDCEEKNCVVKLGIKYIHTKVI